jgi:hypothetical protein
MIRTALAFLVVVLLQAAETAGAQSLTETDARVAQIMRENPDYGILIADVSMRNEKGNELLCTTMTLTLAGTEQKTAGIQTHSAAFLGVGGRRGGISGIKPGLYLAYLVTCDSAGKKNYRGRFAKITIRPGEIVAAGTIVIDYKMHYAILERSSFSGNVHLEEFSPKTVASLKEFSPVTFAKAKKSPFIMLTELEKKEGLTVPAPPAPPKPQR